MFVSSHDFEELLITEIEMRGNEITCLLSTSETKIMNGRMPYSYCDMLPSNASVICWFWISYLDLLDKSSGGIYN
jgi:hypothetical protein